jgi:hypothetical protein
MLRRIDGAVCLPTPISVSRAVENSEPRSIFVPPITFRGAENWCTYGASDTAAARPLMTGRPDANFGLDKVSGPFCAPHSVRLVQKNSAG